MSASIFDIPNWTPSTNYSVNDISIYGGFAYYAKLNHNSSSSFAPGSWNGVTTDFDGSQKPFFFWRPSYNSQVSVTPRVIKTQFGNGYTQRMPDGINNTLLTLNMVFELRSTQESTAISHFLYSRGGTETFLFIPTTPFVKQKRFVCEQWEPTYVFFDNHTIKAVFQEVPF